MATGDKIESIIDHKLFSEDDIEKMTDRLGAQLTKDYAGKFPIVVGALKGAIFFLTKLVPKVDVKMQMDFLDVSSYGNGFSSSGKVKLLTDLTCDVKGRDVLIVEDIVDTGQTLKFMEDLLKKRGAKSVKCCAMLNKTARRIDNVSVDYYGAHVQNEFVVGFGLDYLNAYRNIPYVGVLKQSVIDANRDQETN